jgi:hypothetical protein
VALADLEALCESSVYRRDEQEALREELERKVSSLQRKLDRAMAATVPPLPAEQESKASEASSTAAEDVFGSSSPTKAAAPAVAPAAEAAPTAAPAATDDRPFCDGESAVKLLSCPGSPYIGCYRLRGVVSPAHSVSAQNQCSPPSLPQWPPPRRLHDERRVLSCSGVPACTRYQPLRYPPFSLALPQSRGTGYMIDLRAQSSTGTTTQPSPCAPAQRSAL